MRIHVDDQPIGEVKRLSVEPGDVILLELTEWRSASEEKQIVASVRSLFPDNKIAIMGSGMRITVAEASKNLGGTRDGN